MFPWQIALVTPVRMHESTLGIETLPQQTGVYVARRLVRERVRHGCLWWHRRREPLVLRAMAGPAAGEPESYRAPDVVNPG